jgi:hypothetical protein
MKLMKLKILFLCACQELNCEDIAHFCDSAFFIKVGSLTNSMELSRYEETSHCAATQQLQSIYETRIYITASQEISTGKF